MDSYFTLSVLISSPHCCQYLNYAHIHLCQGVRDQLETWNREGALESH
jgi:hypothetical protein